MVPHRVQTSGSLYSYSALASASCNLLLLLDYWLFRGRRHVLWPGVPSNQITQSIAAGRLAGTVLGGGIEAAASSLLLLWLDLEIEGATEALTEGCKLASLIDLDGLEGLVAGLPGEVVACVLGRLVHAKWRARAHRVCGAVGELDKLGELIRAARATDDIGGAGRSLGEGPAATGP